MRYDGARTATVVGGWSEDGVLTLPLASTFDLDGDTVVANRASQRQPAACGPLPGHQWGPR